VVVEECLGIGEALFHGAGSFGLGGSCPFGKFLGHFGNYYKVVMNTLIYKSNSYAF